MKLDQLMEKENVSVEKNDEKDYSTMLAEICALTS